MIVHMKSMEGKQQYSAENDPRERYIRCICVEVQYILSIYKSQSYGTIDWKTNIAYAVGSTAPSIGAGFILL